MSESTAETALKALHVALATALPEGAALARNAALPARLPAAGMAILRDGDPGAPEVLLSPAVWIYAHRAGVDLLVENGDQSARDAAFDTLKRAVGAALADPTLGGAVEWAEAEAPAPLEIAAEGAEAIKAATVAVVLTYETRNPLD